MEEAPMAVFKCEKCGGQVDTRCKPKKCPQCGESGCMCKEEAPKAPKAKK
jgi:ABC-type ATPase with predicted acetyltransferase domain